MVAMIGLRDLNNADKIVPPIGVEVVDVKTLAKNFKKISFGSYNDDKLSILFDGKPLYLKLKAEGVMMYVGNDNITYVLKFKTENSSPIKVLYNMIWKNKNIKPIVSGTPKPDLYISPSTVDKMATGVAFGYKFDDLKDKVRCITPDGKSTSISCNILYEIEIIVKMDTFIFSDDDSRMPKDGEYDFFACIPTPMVAITLKSPTKNYGRFS